MKQLTYLIQSTLTILTLTSCVQTKKVIQTPIKPALDFEVIELNGSFSNRPIDLNQNGGDPLGKFVFNQLKTYEWTEPIDLQGKIKIDVIDQHTLNIEFWKENSLICETKVSGKVKGSYFQLKRKIRPIGFPFIYFIYQESKILLSTDNEGNLILKQGRADFGNILIFTAGDYQYVNYKFEKTTKPNKK